jgi:sodium pump decarboxylase gamma subunit
MFLAINWGNAIIVTFFGFAIVLVVLILLTYIMELFGKMMSTKKKVQSVNTSSVEIKSTEGPLTVAESAAVAMAIYQYCNAHDEESLVLTLNKPEHPSPWSSKIYGINNINK